MHYSAVAVLKHGIESIASTSNFSSASNDMVANNVAALISRQSPLSWLAGNCLINP
jgi:hypothetical protein